ncbi:hypothetical protein IH992_23315 [Candidatus Poribacteria bacterium]|nr:hypothetical protein [Candidatus Poribacteria bacterium]
MLKTHQSTSSITGRSILIGTLLCILNAYWLAYAAELIRPQFLLNFVSLFFNAIFSLFALIVVNVPLRRFSPRHALTAQEMLVAYIMVVMVSTIGGHTMMTFLIGTLAHPFRFATSENEWADLFWRYIPEWFVPNSNALDGYFEGDSTFYIARHLRGWLVPILVWTGFVALLWFVMICLNTIIRAQWTEKEKLAYPIIQLPLRMAEGGKAFYKSGVMWIGFGVAGFFELLAGLHHLFPQIPAVQLNYYSISHLFTEKPWNAIGWISLSAYPFIIGLTFFVPLDISMSAWFFFLFGKVERIIRVGMMGTGELFFAERAGGAWLAVGVLGLWGTRHHLRDVWQKFLNPNARIDDSQEPMTYRTAIVGLILGLLFLTLFCLKAGMTPGGILGFCVIFLVMAIGVTRVRAEFGPPSHEILALDPARLMTVTFGPRFVGTSNLTIISFYYWLNRLNVSHPMPNQLEGFKIAERARINSRHLVWVMMLATIVGTLASFWAFLHLMYKVGALSVHGYIVGIGNEVFGRRLERWINNPTGPNIGGSQSMGIGAVMTWLLYFLRHRFMWWPFHPIGYVMTAATWGGLADFWFSVFLGWLVKFVILMVFGLRAHQRAIPFFLGLVMGDYVFVSMWALIGTLFNIPTYVLWSP